MKKLAMLLLVLALCLPSYGDILVYRVHVAAKAIDSTGDDAILSSGSIRGYLVIDIDTTDPEADPEAGALILYGKDGNGDKVQINEGDLIWDYSLYAMAKADTYAVFAELYGSIDDGDLVDTDAVLIGKTVLTNIGFGAADKRPVPMFMKGNVLLWSDPFDVLDIGGSGVVQASLHLSWTKAYNAGEGTAFDDVVIDIMEEKLAGYDDITP